MSKKHRKKAARLLAMSLSACMVINSASITSLAASAELGEIGSESVFDYADELLCSPDIMPVEAEPVVSVDESNTDIIEIEESAKEEAVTDPSEENALPTENVETTSENVEIQNDTEIEMIEQDLESVFEAVDNKESEIPDIGIEDPDMVDILGDVWGDFTYSVDDDGNVTITKYNGSDADVTIPAKINGHDVVEIDANAFKENNFITKVVIPDSVISIGHDAFANCSNLVNITLSKNLTTLGYHAFMDCDKIETIWIPKTLTTTNTGNSNYYVGPFRNCDGLKKITIEEGMSKIPGNLFKYCSGLEEIELPSTLTEIEYCAFDRCTSLKTVQIPDSVTEIGHDAFAYCSNLSDVTLPKNLTTLGYHAFIDCDKIETIWIPKKLTTTNTGNFDSYVGPFRDCDGLKKITIEEGMTKIPGNLFKYCSGMEEIELPSTLTEIEYCAFDRCTSLKTVQIPDSVTEIGHDAFAYCSNLSDVTLSKNLTTLGYHAFIDCDKIETIWIPKKLTTTNTGNFDSYVGPFRNCDGLKKVTFEEGITLIAPRLFKYCVGLETVIIPDTVTEIGESAFEECNNLKELTIGNSVNIIGNYAFQKCNLLKNIIISDSVWSIGYRAFAECANLENVKLPKNIGTICAYAFYNCDKLNNVEIPKKLNATTTENWGSYAGVFNNCDGLKNVTFEEGTTTVVWNLFTGCTGLEEIVVPSTVETIEEKAFPNCSNLRRITLQNGLKAIGNSAFEKCNSLQEIVIPDSVNSMGTYTFSGCTSLTKAVLPNGRINITEGTFNNCTSLKDVYIPDSVQYVREKAFYNTALEEITLPDSVLEIKSEAFRKTSKLKKVTLGKSITIVDASAFRECPLLEEVVLNDNVKALGQCAFCDNPGLKSFVIPDSVTGLGTYIFSDNENLESVTFGTGITSIPSYVFDGCSKLDNVVLPYNVKSIQSNAFTKCTNLTSITIPPATTSIADNVFSYPTKMVIYGISGSYAEEYANRIGATFVHKEVPATEIALNKTKMTLSRYSSERLVLTVAPDGFTDEVVWRSRNTDVVTVDDNGKVYAAGAGTATVEVMVGDLTASCEVKVIIPVSSVYIDSNFSLEALETRTLNVSYSPYNATTQGVTWSSSDTSIATVDKNGKVTAKKKGKAVITATAKDGYGASDTCEVTVINNVTKCTKVSQMQSAHNYPNNCNDGWIYTIKNANNLVVKFDKRTEMEEGYDYLYIFDSTGTQVGKYTGKELASKTIKVPGDTVKIKIESDKAGNKWGFAVTSIKSQVPATELSLTKTTLTLQRGKQETLEFAVKPNETTDTIKWISDDESIVTVDQNGKLTGKGLGTTTVHVYAVSDEAATGNEAYLNALQAICTVTVVQPVTAISLDQTSVRLKTGETATIKATAVPSDASDKKVTWSSSNKKIATVNSKGVVTAVAPGTVTITATAADGSGVKATSTVQVIRPVTGITLNKTTASVDISKTEKLLVTVAPEDASIKKVKWTSSDKSIATVDANGVILPVKIGTVTITATATDGSDVKATCKVTIGKLVTKVTLNKTTADLTTGNSLTLKATATPTDATNKKINWSSSDKKIATVDAKGVVTAVGPGTVTITATAADGSGKKATCTINVTQPVTGITMNKTTSKIELGKSETLKATVTPDNASNKTLKWTTSDKTVATVTSKGVVKAVGLGTATITATATDGSGKKATCKVTVVKFVTGITLNKAIAQITTGKTLTLKATVAPTDATDKTVKWSSSDKKIATVDAKGVVTAVAPGTVIITATAADGSGIKSTCEITVIQKVTGITLNKTSAELKPKETVTLKATVAPANASNKSVKWTTSDKTIATVSSKGVVTAVAPGTATITATAADGSGIKSTCKVTVAKKVTGISLNKTETILHAKETIELEATVSPEDATNKKVEWTSSDQTVATVDANGKVTAVAPGTASITVTAADGSGIENTCIVKVKQLVTDVFNDINSSDWWVGAVQFVYDREIMNGTSDSSFGPKGVLTREQFITVLYNMEGAPEIAFKQIYDDVKNEPGVWYAKSVTWASENGITSGVGNGMFGTGKEITREQLATLLYNYAQLKDAYKLTIDENAVTNFPDTKEISSWASDGIKWAVTNGVMGGKTGADGKNILDPQGKATRAECAQMIKNLQEKAIK